MPRHVIALAIASGKPVLRGEDHMWSVIRELDRRGPWAVPDIDAAGQETRATVVGYVRRLLKAGLVKEAGSRPVGIRGHKAKLYRLTRRPAETPRLRRDGAESRRGRGQEQMWTAMRALGTFSVAELAVAATTEDVAVPATTAGSYVRHLATAGYLVPAPSGTRARSWRLKPSMNSGPKPPLILQTRLVWDQNRGRPAGDVLAEEMQ